MIKNLNLLLLVLLFSLNVSAQAEYPFGTIMKRVFDDEVIKASSNAAKAKAFLNAQQQDGSWKDIDYQKTTITEWEPSEHFNRLLPMISAYIYEKSTLYQNAALKKGIDKALQYWSDNDFYSDNWWHNEIAIPKAIGVSLILMKFGKDKIHSDLEDVLVFKMIKGDPYAKTGANKSDIAMHYFYRSLITEDKNLLASSLEQLFYPVQLVDDKEGLQYDYSYLQHGPQLYIAGYGEEFMKGISKVMAYVRETPYAIDPDRLELFSNFVKNTYLPIIRSGYIDFNVHGRGMSRPNILKKKGEAGILRQMILVDPKNATVWEKGIAKLDSSVRYNSHTDHKHTHYWKADYTTHLRKGYHFNVRMASNRTNKSESGNQENIYGKHMTDGVTNIQVFGPEYYNIFPIWEWDKVPGTTTRDAKEDEVLKEQWGVPAANKFAGGVSASNYGVSAMKVDYDGVVANKSWFFFDKAIVCLGSGITSQSEDPIVTTVNQTWLVDGVLHNDKPVHKSESLAFATQANDIIAHRQVIYQFPVQTDLRLTTKEQKGTWYKINRARPKGEQKGDVFKLWIDHGVKPVDASYAYIVYPATGRLDNEEASAIEIIENTDKVQAVRHKGLHVLQIVFYEAGEFRKDGITIRVNAPILMQLYEEKGMYDLSVADPYQSLSQVQIQVSGDGIQQDLTVELPQNQFKGATKTIKIKGNTVIN